ncbi:MAG: hypothetical protein JNJ83_10770 [Verrucomicrobiaceae bacterium]|nr:hypothetical protein [Verrucomicrobiaceae bacterium]
MIEEPLMFTGRLTLEDVLNIRTCRKRLEMRPSIRWLIVFMSSFIATILIMAIYRDGPRLGLVIMLLGCCYFPVGGLILDRRATITHFRKHERDYEDTTVEISEDVVTTRSVSAITTLAWKHIGVVADTSEGLMFLSHALQTWFWLPRRILTDGTREAVLSFAKQNGTTVRQVPLSLFGF